MVWKRGPCQSSLFTLALGWNVAFRPCKHLSRLPGRAGGRGRDTRVTEQIRGNDNTKSVAGELIKELATPLRMTWGKTLRRLVEGLALSSADHVNSSNGQRKDQMLKRTRDLHWGDYNKCYINCFNSVYYFLEQLPNEAI